MRTLERYIAGIFIKNFLLGVLALVFLFTSQSFLADLVDGSYSLQQLLFYHALNIPAVFVQMAPPSVLIATVFTISGLTRTNELVACFSIGIGMARISAIIVSLVFMISCFSVFLQDRILPPFFKSRTSFYWREMKKKTDFYFDIKQDKIWYRSKNLIYNLKSFDSKTKSIKGMTVYHFDENFQIVQVVDADRAQYTPTGWRLQDGIVTVFTPDNPFPQTIHFKDKDLLIAETPKDFQEIEKEVDGLRIMELMSYIKRTKGSGSDTKAYEVKWHARLSLSFIPLVMCFLGIPFSTRGRREGGVAKDLGICLGVTFFYWLFYSVGLSLGTNGAITPWLAAWLPSVIFAGLAVLLISRQNN